MYLCIGVLYRRLCAVLNAHLIALVSPGWVTRLFPPRDELGRGGFSQRVIAAAFGPSPAGPQAEDNGACRRTSVCRSKFRQSRPERFFVVGPSVPTVAWGQLAQTQWPRPDRRPTKPPRPPQYAPAVKRHCPHLGKSRGRTRKLSARSSEASDCLPAKSSADLI